MGTEIIKLYDNEGYDYPLIEIEKGSLNKFKSLLTTYQQEEDYNIDDFVNHYLKGKEWFITVIESDWELFF